MSLQNNQEGIHMGASGTDVDIESIITALANEETGMANEIYELAQKLKTALEPSHLEDTDNAELIENLNGVNSSIQNTLTSVIKKEIAVIGKIEKVLKPSHLSDNGDIPKQASTSEPVPHPIKHNEAN